MSNDIEIGTLYDLNKQLVETKEKVISPYKLNEKKKIIKQFITESKDNYFMLLCNEQRDYTLFNILNSDKNENKLNELSNVLVDECLKNRGEIKGIDLTQSKDAIEIWISISGESFCYYFFPYNAGVVEV
ncbi:MAG: hypothetical protein ACI4PE_02945 [Bacilli bacterium]